MSRINRSTRSAAPRLALAAGALAALASAAHADFTYGDFSSVVGLNLVGATSRLGNNLELSPNRTREAGAVWAMEKQQVGSDFRAAFTFRIGDLAGDGADGIAFVIQNASSSAMGGTGGGIGYGTNIPFAQPGIPNSIAVEFDTWNNSPADWDDLDANHVSVQTRGLMPNSPDHTYSRGAAHVPFDLSDGGIHLAVVNYLAPNGPGQGTLQVFIDNLVAPILTVGITIADTINLDADGKAWIGLTGATGGVTDVEAHELRRWEFSNPIVPAPGAAALLSFAGLAATIRRRRSN